jgi:endogenous inhibitor of DNA gyrase (YacG/DUF329 family)
MSAAAEKSCARCGKRPRTAAHAPFCSAGCKDRDLLAWLGEDYRLPVAEEEQPALDNGEGAAIDAASRPF